MEIRSSRSVEVEIDASLACPESAELSLDRGRLPRPKGFPCFLDDDDDSAMRAASHPLPRSDESRARVDAHRDVEDVNSRVREDERSEEFQGEEGRTSVVEGEEDGVSVLLVGGGGSETEPRSNGCELLRSEW